MKKEISLNELPEVVEEFLNNLKIGEGATVVGLCGDLGVGKTTFVKEFAKQLEIEKEITSPTFTVLQKHQIPSTNSQTNHKSQISKFQTLVHIDLYRFEEFEETKVLKLEEVFENPENLVLIEWADKFESIKTDIKINFSHKSETTREIEIIYG